MQGICLCHHKNEEHAKANDGEDVRQCSKCDCIFYQTYEDWQQACEESEEEN